jgi:hypothetical protein
MRLTSSVALLAPLLIPAAVLAQRPCRVPTSSNEAKLLYYYAVPIAFSMPVRPPQLGVGGISLGGDLTYIPEPPREIQTTSRCYNPPKTEASNLSPVLPRPRLAIGLPFGLVAEASYLPPVTVNDATPNLLSFALSTEIASLLMSATPVRVLVRAHTTIGKVEGPITCSKSMLQQSSRLQPCFGVNVSADTYRPNIFGAEGVFAFGAPGGRLGAYAGAGATMLNPRFQVGFTSQDGAVDTSRVEPEERVIRPVLLAGGWARVISRLDLGLQLYSVPADLTVVRGGANFRIR